MGVEVEQSGPPDPALIGSPDAAHALVTVMAPLTPPPGATDLTRSVYCDRGLSIWCYGRADGPPRPGVLLVHGGGWAGGGPSAHLRHAYELAARGYVAALLEYRLTSAGHTWPAPLEDVLDGLRWMRSHADALGLASDRLVVGGGSAGGHLAAMAALDPATALSGAVLWYPAVDLRIFVGQPGYQHAVDALLPGASADELLAASPLSRVRPGAPPVLTMAGDVDPCTTLASLERFHAALDDAGVRNRLVVFKGRAHGFDFHPADWPQACARMLGFVDEVFGEAGDDEPAPQFAWPWPLG
jgi:acetyl esterase/lipase